jgi:hypothetical protein
MWWRSTSSKILGAVGLLLLLVAFALGGKPGVSSTMFYLAGLVALLLAPFGVPHGRPAGQTGRSPMGPTPQWCSSASLRALMTRALGLEACWGS